MRRDHHGFLDKLQKHAQGVQFHQRLDYKSHPRLQSQHLVRLHPNLGQIDEIPLNEWKPLKAGKLLEKDFLNLISDFYLTNPIARASSVMAELSAAAKARNNSKVAAE